ncbi:phosphate-starvation-inducible PsiE family protein [Candidatus Pyrohabitans sp.]
MTEERVLYRRVHDIFRKTLETIQDLIIIGLSIIVFYVSLKVLMNIVSEVSQAFEFQRVVSEILYIMILVETYRMLIVYLKEHRVAVSFMAEIALVAVLREVILTGALEIPPLTLAMATLFILALVFVIKFTVREERADIEEKGFLHTELRGLLKRSKGKRRFRGVSKSGRAPKD